MTKDFTAIARTGRLIALNEIANRKSQGTTIAKFQTSASKMNRHVEAVFRSRRTMTPVVALAA